MTTIQPVHFKKALVQNPQATKDIQSEEDQIIQEEGPVQVLDAGRIGEVVQLVGAMGDSRHDPQMDNIDLKAAVG